MNAFTLKMFMALLQGAPQIATDIENAVKTAESPEDGAAKLKAYLTDFENAIKVLAELL